MDIDILAEKVCENRNILIGELHSGRRRHRVVKARHVLSWIGVRELGYSGAEMARYLGVTTSCINRFLSSGEKPDVDYDIHKL